MLLLMKLETMYDHFHIVLLSLINTMNLDPNQTKEIEFGLFLASAQ